MTSQKDKNEKRANELKIRTHHELGRTKKPLRKRDKYKGKYKVPQEIKIMKGIKQEQK